ncbi:unnamed protein product [Umbelopsis ramanniana]
MPSYFFKDDSTPATQEDLTDESHTLLIQAQREFINHRYDKAVPLLERAAAFGSFRAAMSLASVSMREEHMTVCQNCHTAAKWYIRALELLASKNTHLPCTPESLELVEQIVELLSNHMLANLTSKEGRTLSSMLWSMSKEFKPRAAMKLDEAELAKLTPLEQNQVFYARALCIVIYNCRGFLYQADRNADKARHYYIKCVNVPPTGIHSCDIAQRSAEMSLGYLDRDTGSACSPLLAPSSPTSSIHSSHQCAGCNTEKQMMPVCSRCKVRRYCSNKCRIDHAADHEQECLSVQAARQ